MLIEIHSAVTKSKIAVCIIVTILLLTITACSKLSKNSDIVVKIVTSPTEGFPPLEVLLDASSSHDKAGKTPLRFIWKFPDGSQFDGPTLLKGFEEPGEHVVRLEVSNGTNTKFQEIKIHVKTIPESNIQKYQLASESNTIIVDNTLKIIVPSGPSDRVLTVSHLPISTQPACSPFTIIDAWKVDLDIPKNADHMTQNVIITFPVPAEISDPIIIEWMGDFWVIAENEGGAPGGTFDPINRTISIERTHLSTFALATFFDPVLKALDKLPDIPPKPIFNYAAEGLPNGEIAVDITLASPNLVSYTIRDFNLGFGGMWYCIDFQGDNKIKLTWDQPPTTGDFPLLRPGIEQKGRVILPGTGATFTVCLRPGCSDALIRACVNWAARLGLPLETGAALMSSVVENVWQFVEKLEKIKTGNFSDALKDIIKFSVKLLYSLVVKHLTHHNYYVFVVNALPVAGDIAAFILGTLKSKLGFEPDPCWTVTIPPLPTIVTETLPSGTIGKGYEATLEVKGGDPPYAWSIVSGNLPPGLTLKKESGRITGIPTAEGAWKFVVKVADKNGLSAQKSFEVSVGPSAVQPRSPEISGEYVLYGQSEETEIILRLDNKGQFTIIGEGEYMIMVLAQGTYKQLSKELLLFELIPGVMQVKARILPNGNAIIGTLTLSFAVEVWIKRGVPIPQLVDIVGTYKKVDSADKYISLSLGPSQNQIILTIASSQLKCAYLCEYSPKERDIKIRWFAPGSERRECDLLLASSISLFVIDSEYIYTSSLLDEQWTGIWEKTK